MIQKHLPFRLLRIIHAMFLPLSQRTFPLSKPAPAKALIEVFTISSLDQLKPCKTNRLHYQKHDSV